jgi:hypothetical protein
VKAQALGQTMDALRASLSGYSLRAELRTICANLKSLPQSPRRLGRLALPTRACPATVLQPRPHGRFLVDTDARAAAQEAAQLG